MCTKRHILRVDIGSKDSPEIHQNAAGNRKVLATSYVSVCSRSSGAGAKSGTHDPQVFTCEASLLLQLTLREREGENGDKIFMRLTAGKRDCSFRRDTALKGKAARMSCHFLLSFSCKVKIKKCTVNQ